MKNRLRLAALCALGLTLAACHRPQQKQSQETVVIVNPNTPSPAPEEPTITGVTIEPNGTITLTRTLVNGVCSAEKIFSATVTGTGDFYKRAGWSVTPITDGVSLTPISDEPPQAKFVSTVKGTFKVYAYSSRDYTKRSPDVTVIVVGDCNGGGGPTPPPSPHNDLVVDFTANPTQINRGDSSNLRLRTENADSCTGGASPISGEWNGGKPVQYDQRVSPTSTTLYNVTCRNATQEVTKTAMVTVVNTPPPPPVNPPSCAVINSTGGNVLINSVAQFSASGGDGNYSWSAAGGSPSSGGGASFSTTYTSVGTKTVTLTSAGLTGQCQVTIVAPPPPPQQTCPTGGINYMPPGGTAYVNRNTSVSAQTPSPWPSYCQIVYYTDRPSILQVLGADAVYQVCDASGNSCVWYYAGRNGVIRGVSPGTAKIFVAVIQIGSDDKWRLVPGGVASHDWTVVNPPPGTLAPGNDPMPKVYGDPRVSQIAAPWMF